LASDFTKLLSPDNNTAVIERPNQSKSDFTKLLTTDKVAVSEQPKSDFTKLLQPKQPSIIETGTPEQPINIAAQYRDMLDPNTGKDSVFVGANTDDPVKKAKLPDSIFKIESPAGTLYTTNKAKAEAYKADQTDENRAKILGYNEPKSEILNSGKEPQAVVVKDADGYRIAEELTTDPNTVIAKYKKQGYKNIAIESPMQTQINRALPADPQSGMTQGFQGIQPQTAGLEPSKLEKLTQLPGKPLVAAAESVKKNMPSLSEWKAIVANPTFKGYTPEEYKGGFLKEVNDRAFVAATKVIPFAKLMQKAMLAGKPDEVKKAYQSQLENMPKEFTGVGSITVPLTADLVKLAVDWKYLYPAYFKVAGLSNEAIASIPAFKKAGQIIENSGGIKAIADKFPRIYQGVKNAIGASIAGFEVGAGVQAVEGTGQGTSYGQQAKDIAASGGKMAALAGLFSGAGSIDARLKLRADKQAMIKRLDTQIRQTVAEIPSAPGSAAVVRSVESLKNAGLKRIDEIIAAHESDITGFRKGNLYPNVANAELAKTKPAQEIQRFLQYGYEPTRKIDFKAPEPLKSGMGVRKPTEVLANEPATRVGEIAQAITRPVETVKGAIKGVRESIKPQSAAEITKQIQAEAIKAPMGSIRAVKNSNGKYEVKMGSNAPDNPFTNESFIGEFDTAQIARSSYNAWFNKQQQQKTKAPISEQTAVIEPKTAAPVEVVKPAEKMSEIIPDEIAKPITNKGLSPEIIEKTSEKESAILKTDQFPIEEVSIENILLSKDVPNFKEGANKNTGVVQGEELQGKYNRLGTAPILVWQRENGDMEVITGRHRLDLARRTGEKTIPAQIVKEADGFDKAMALTSDAESNIRDGQGKVRDYAQYFKNTEIDEGTARERGLLSRAKGKAGFIIGKSAVDDVFARFLGGKLTEAKAEAIAVGAPKNESVQLAAAAEAENMSADELEQYTRILARTKPSDNVKAKQGNLFGFDDSAINEAKAVSKEVSKESNLIKDRILAVKGALRRPEVAKKMGLEFSDEAHIRAEVKKLEDRLEALRHTSTTPELYAEMKQRSGLSPETAEKQAARDNIAPQNTAEAGITKPETINRDYKIIKEKLGEKKAQNYFSQVYKLVNPNQNEIAEYRTNGIVVKEGDKYLFKAIAGEGTKASPYRLSDWKPQDVTSSFNQPAPEDGGAKTQKPPISGKARIVKSKSGIETIPIAKAKGSLSDDVSDWLDKGHTITESDFFKLADAAYGGTRAEGKYQISDAYDELELGVNKHLKGKTDPTVKTAKDAVVEAGKARAILDKIPVQKNRSGEKDTMQQFSTPPDYAYAISWLANINENDIVLEPSAGTGSIAVHAVNAKPAKVIGNELSVRRAELLKEIGVDEVRTEDAEQIHNIFEEKPSVVLMNPPFSRAASRMGNEKVLGTDLRHIDAALKLLQDKGRLVAIMGRPLHEAKGENKSFIVWLNGIKAKYDVKANIYVNRDIYKKYGTSFPTRVLVIDKVRAKERKIIGGTVDSIDQLLYTLDGVRNERQRPKQVETKSGLQKPADTGEAGSQPGDIIQSSVDIMGAGKLRPQGSVEQRTTGTSRPSRSNVKLESAESKSDIGAGDVAGRRDGLGQGTAGQQGQSTGSNRANRQSVQLSENNQAGIKPDSSVDVVRIERRDSQKNKSNKKLTDNVFESYKPTKVYMPGSKSHPASLVESAAMAAVQSPDMNYELKIPKVIVAKGLLSDIQLEAIAYVGQAHSQTLPEDTGGVVYRKGFMIGDGTGVGKGREIAGTILDNWQHGRRKVVWLSENQKLFNDAMRDWVALGQDKATIFNFNKIKAGAPIQAKQGVLYSTYDTLKSKSKDKDAKSRLEQVIDWLGADFDGLIVFDESHNMSNATPKKGSAGTTKPSNKALAGVDLQKKLPNARVLYVSATAATEVDNLVYADRLGLWGAGTPFANKFDFINKISEGGVATMELVARDMKALGLYVARNLSFNDGTKEGTVEYKRLEHVLTPEQRKVYNKLADAWQVVLNNINEALKVTAGSYSRDGEPKINKDAKRSAMSLFWSAHQRFFNQIITAMQAPSMVNAIEKDLANNESVVIQLTNTFEAAQERALSQRDTSDEDGLDDFDITPRDMIMQLIERSFPTAQYEEYVDENGNKSSRIVKDSKGNTIQNKEAVAMRERLLDQLGSIVVPESPLDMIINHFGIDKVAEVTGRKRRVVFKRQENGEMKKVIDKRPPASSNPAEIARFMNGQKRILIFSEAGGTGASYHADRIAKNKQHRSHYLFQAGWRADKAVQGLGRTHRSNQVNAPTYTLVTTDLKGQKRFISTIARRLDQLGALTKGERKAGSTGIFSAADNLESIEAHEAMRTFFSELARNQIEDLDVATFQKQTGLKLVDEQGNLLQTLPPIRQFLNRLLSLNIDYQNKVFDEFESRLQHKVEQAIAEGTLDQGIENYRADKIETIEQKTIYKHPQSGSETQYVKLKIGRKIEPITWSVIQKRKVKSFVQSSKGKLYAVIDTHARTESTTGRIIGQYRLIDQSISRFIDKDNIDYDRHDNWKTIDKAKAENLWNNAVDDLPKMREHEEHLITGLILPIWDRLNGKARVYRILTDDGELLVGRIIPASEIQRTLQNLGATSEAPEMSPNKAVKGLLGGDFTIDLVNGWRIKSAVVGGEKRIELTGSDFQNDIELGKIGVFKERIAYKTRYFIPTADTETYEEVVKRWPISNIDYASSRDTGFQSDPQIDVDPTGEGGFVIVPGGRGERGKTQKNWLDTDKVKSPDAEIEDFFGRTLRPPYVKKASSLIEKASAYFRERFVFAHHAPQTPETAYIRDLIRTMPEERRYAFEKAVKDIIAILDGDGTVQALDSAGLDLLRRKVFVQDILHEAEISRSVSGNLKIEQLQAEDARLDELIAKVPSVKKAYEARQKLWENVSKDLLDRGVLGEEEAANRAYVRHFVLDLAEKNRPTGFKKKKLSDPYRSYSKHRKGSVKDISTDYLSVEVKALGEIYADNVVEDVANKIGEKEDKRKAYTSAAKAVNFRNLVGGQENVKRIMQIRAKLQETTGSQDSDILEQRKELIAELTDLDPTYPYRKRIAMHLSKLKKKGTYNELEDDTSGLFKELARLAAEESKSPLGLAARGVFKAMAERDKMIRDTLGKEYLTPEKLAMKDGYVEWFYKRPNVFYRAQTLNESQIAAFVENSAEEVGDMLHIPKSKLRAALVLGRRKGMIIPDWLAAQLDDLPVNKRSGYVTRSFTTPFIQFWKRWILRVNPIRYNFRNQLGDTERLNASGQTSRIKNIPQALKMLITKEGELYTLAKQFGVINSVFWHEMNDVSKLPEFEKFKNISYQKNFKQAIASLFTLPVKTISRVGSIEQTLTQMREDVLRLAVFIGNYEDLKAGKPARHWAGQVADIEAIAKEEPARAAAKISRETLGDYGLFTPFENDVLRQGILPFYSWIKLNTTFWPRVLKNAAKEGTAGRNIAAGASIAGLNISKWLIRALWAYAAAYLWNHRDDEASKKEETLPFWLRAIPHVNIGKVTLWGQTALSDFMEWFGMDELAGVMWRKDAGFLDAKEAALEAAKVIAESPVNKMYQALNPFLKAPITGITGQSTYPNVFKPHFVAKPASTNSLERAILDIMGGDAKKFYQTAVADKKGNRRAFDDTLNAYFAGWFMRQTDEDTMLEEIWKTKEWTTLKRNSKTTGRVAGDPKKGKEAEWEESKIRERALY
jgi:predicted RNA methylase